MDRKVGVFLNFCHIYTLIHSLFPEASVNLPVAPVVKGGWGGTLRKYWANNSAVNYPLCYLNCNYKESSLQVSHTSDNRTEGVQSTSCINRKEKDDNYYSDLVKIDFCKNSNEPLNSFPSQTQCIPDYPARKYYFN